MDAFNGKYFNALNDRMPNTPFADSNLPEYERQIVSNWLYNDPILNASPRNASGIFSMYAENISRDDFVYLLMSALSKNFPGSFNIVSGTLLSNPTGDAYTDTKMPYINMAYDFGIIGNTGDGLFNPNGVLSHQEAAEILSKAVQKLSEMGYISSSAFKATETEPQAMCSKIYALREIWLFHSFLKPFAPARPTQAAGDIAQVAPVSCSIISGEFLSPGAFIADAGPNVKARFQTAVDFAAPGSKTIDIILSDSNGTVRSIQAHLTVYVGVHSISQRDSADSNGIGLNSFVFDAQNSGMARMLTNRNYFVYAKPGQFYAAIELGSNISYCAVNLIDRTPPSATPKTVEISTGKQVSPDDFVTGIIDSSKVFSNYANGAPDVNAIGEQNVAINLMDEFGNFTIVNSKLVVNEVSYVDTAPPVFDFIPNRYYQTGSEPDYLTQVIATDDYDLEPDIAYDASSVDTSRAGRYPVAYTATDESGNAATARAFIIMTDTSIDDVFSMADRVLASITNDGMSQWEKARAIYNWVSRNVAYVNAGAQIDPINGAYIAFTRGRGNCYQFYAASEILLTRAGIKNLYVARLGSNVPHFWSFVDYGDGWYYFDATPYALRMDGFMFTDATAKARYGAGGRNYNFDRSLYPNIDLR
jgi:hypothetical protein